MAITAPADMRVRAGRQVTLFASSDGPSCTWSQVSGPAVRLTSLGLAVRFRAPLIAGPVVLRAHDGTTQDDVVVTVTGASSRPSGRHLWGRTGRELAGMRDVLAQPFEGASIWNAPIGDKAVYVPLGLTAPTNGYSTDDVHIVFTPGAPLRSLVDRGYWWPWTSGTSVPGTDTGVQVQVPDTWIIAPPGPTSFPNNATAAIQANGLAREFQYTVRPTAGSNISISDAPRATFDLAGSGTSADYGAHGGSGMTCIGGTIRHGELTGPDPIRHALAFTMNMRKWGTQQGGAIVNGYRWPAIAADAYYDGPNGYGVRGGGGKDGLGMGSLLAIPKSVSLSTLGFETTQAAKIGKALQDFGAYVVDDSDDDGGNWDCHLLNVEPGVHAEFPGIDTDNMDTAFKRDMDKLFTRLALVDSNGPSSVGGGGLPAAHPARAAATEPTMLRPQARQTFKLGEPMQQGDNLPPATAALPGWFSYVLPAVASPVTPRRAEALWLADGAQPSWVDGDVVRVEFVVRGQLGAAAQTTAQDQWHILAQFYGPADDPANPWGKFVKHGLKVTRGKLFWYGGDAHPLHQWTQAGNYAYEIPLQTYADGTEYRIVVEAKCSDDPDGWFSVWCNDVLWPVGEKWRPRGHWGVFENAAWSPNYPGVKYTHAAGSWVTVRNGLYRGTNSDVSHRPIYEQRAEVAPVYLGPTA